MEKPRKPVPRRTDTPEERHRRWKHFFGHGFGVNTKRRALYPLLAKMDESGRLGPVIVDAGSGSLVQMDMLGRKKGGVFYPLARKKIMSSYS